MSDTSVTRQDTARVALRQAVSNVLYSGFMSEKHIDDVMQLIDRYSSERAIAELEKLKYKAHSDYGDGGVVNESEIDDRIKRQTALLSKVFADDWLARELVDLIAKKAQLKTARKEGNNNGS